MAGVIVVFDFDKTIIDVDSDNWVVDNLGFTEQFERLHPTMPWNTLMDTMMGELHTHGKNLADIAVVLESAPLDPRVPAAYALGCDLHVLSDANAFFIDTILAHHGLRGLFTEVNTNPSHVDPNTGRLRIGLCHHFDPSSGPAHGCDVGTCPPNMCKGLVLDRILREAQAARKRVVYLGDRHGDYCPALRLRRGEDSSCRAEGSPCGTSSATTPHGCRPRCTPGPTPPSWRTRCCESSGGSSSRRPSHSTANSSPYPSSQCRTACPPLCPSASTTDSRSRHYLSVLFINDDHYTTAARTVYYLGDCHFVCQIGACHC
ncbi:hypothetical protein PR202_gb04923 [Eleusine coracana subsp. coracana]|uniref:Uncharacterized protein n=1 Tax=Eleusine coracana subsp. coracana TaxID=191504 RepID=A0AAV5E5R3_ELECO|nr:hypothetical protein QOZ80_1BG0081710 [Eleusine coracana subsp. coracana]GJN17824.1 hypothetical protein PR202_gb04923 [Eleusine coracana subsp. coracana]